MLCCFCCRVWCFYYVDSEDVADLCFAECQLPTEVFAVRASSPLNFFANVANDHDEYNISGVLEMASWFYILCSLETAGPNFRWRPARSAENLHMHQLPRPCLCERRSNVAAVGPSHPSLPLPLLRPSLPPSSSSPPSLPSPPPDPGW